MADSILKAIAVDDEQHCLDTLVWELERQCPEVNVIQQITNEEEAIRIIPKVDVDILFMDIHLQSKSGIELIKELHPIDCQVIFTTAYDQYAIEAFEVEAVDYLLKPVNPAKLRLAVDRVMSRKMAGDTVAVDRILKAMADTHIGQQRIPFNVHSGIEFVIPEEIIYVSGENNYSLLHFSSGKTLMVSKTLSSVEKALENHTFLRIHKSYLLNLKHIVRYVKSDGGYIEVEGGDMLSVSRSKRSTINELFK